MCGIIGYLCQVCLLHFLAVRSADKGLPYEDVPTEDFADCSILLPPMAEMTAPPAAMVKLQLLAYYVAKEKGCDIDRPRNLAKVLP